MNLLTNDTRSRIHITDYDNIPSFLYSSTKFNNPNRNHIIFNTLKTYIIIRLQQKSYILPPSRLKKSVFDLFCYLQ